MCAPREGIARRGFTLAELVVAVVLLAVGVGALASTAAYVLHETTASRNAELAAHVARIRFDRLRIGRCASASGIEVHGALTERWQVAVAGDGGFATTAIAWADRGHEVVQRYRTEFPC